MSKRKFEVGNRIKYRYNPQITGRIILYNPIENRNYPYKIILNAPRALVGAVRWLRAGDMDMDNYRNLNELVTQ